MRFFFRLEVSPEIGAGHFFRCFTLAKQLIDSGWAEQSLPAQSKFVATVLGENTSSQRLFDRLNYRLERREFSKGSNS